MTVKELIIKLYTYPENTKIVLDDISKMFSKEEENVEDDLKIEPSYCIYIEYHPYFSTKTDKIYTKTKPSEDDIKEIVKSLRGKEHIDLIEVRKKYIIL